MCCFFNKAYLRIPFDIIKKPKVILLYHCWNHVLFSFIVVKDAASHSTNYSLPRGGGYQPNPVTSGRTKGGYLPKLVTSIKGWENPHAT